MRGLKASPPTSQSSLLVAGTWFQGPASWSKPADIRIKYLSISGLFEGSVLRSSSQKNGDPLKPICPPCRLAPSSTNHSILAPCSCIICRKGLAGGPTAVATSIVQMESNPHREHKAAPMPEPPTNPEADMEFAGRKDMIFLKNRRMGPWTLSFSSGLQNHTFQMFHIRLHLQATFFCISVLLRF